MIVQSAFGTTQIDFVEPCKWNDLVPETAIVVSDDEVASRYGKFLPRRMVTFAAGEKQKNLRVFQSLAEQILALRPDRQTMIVALGGGVVGDMAGFLAATILRGVPLIQIPTTLLAMVDSSIGGKVGVDTEAGKNLVGAFKPADHVLVSVSVLASLPRRQVINGMAEVWKYGFIGNRPSLDLLAMHRVESGEDVPTELLLACMEHKKRVVEEDEFETAGLRATLNFGHTIGHAIEKVLGYEHLLHGEAIAIGMVLESQLGERLGVTPAHTTQYIRNALGKQGLPTDWEERRNSERLLRAMRSDKKATNGSLAFSLLTQLGACKLFTSVDEAIVRSVLEE
jgi:3-dehydroquinate synthase